MVDNTIVLVILGILIAFFFICMLIAAFSAIDANECRDIYRFRRCMGNVFLFLTLIIFILKITDNYLYSQRPASSIEDYYISNDILDENGVSEYEFRKKINSELGNEIIDDAVEDNRISVQEDGRVYIGQQELLEALGLD